MRSTSAKKRVEPPAAASALEVAGECAVDDERLEGEIVEVVARHGELADGSRGRRASLRNHRVAADVVGADEIAVETGSDRADRGTRLAAEARDPSRDARAVGGTRACGNGAVAQHRIGECHGTVGAQEQRARHCGAPESSASVALSAAITSSARGPASSISA